MRQSPATLELRRKACFERVHAEGQHMFTSCGTLDELEAFALETSVIVASKLQLSEHNADGCERGVVLFCRTSICALPLSPEVNRATAVEQASVPSSLTGAK